MNMSKIFNNILYLYQWLTFRRKAQFFLIVIFSVFVSAIEMAAVGSIVPFISTLLDSKSVFGDNLIFYLKKVFQITTKDNLIATLGIIFVTFSIITAICRSVLIYIISYYSNVVLAEIGKTIYNQKDCRLFAVSLVSCLKRINDWNEIFFPAYKMLLCSTFMGPGGCSSVNTGAARVG